MGRARFLHTTLITAASMLTPSSQAPGRVSRAQKEGAGSALMLTEGEFTGGLDLDYLVQIDALGTGEIGSSTFRWSDDDGATIDATGILTSTSFVVLNNGVRVAFAGGSGADFVLGDLWRFRAFLPYGKARMLERDRDTEFRTGSPAGGALTVDVDLGSAQQADVVALLDHNLTAGATIKIQADDDPAFGSLGVDETITWTSGRLVRYLTTTPRSFRYWRLRITDTANPDGYLRWSLAWLGTYTELSNNFSLAGYLRTTVRRGTRSVMESGRVRGALNAAVETFDVQWALLTDADRDLLVTVYQALLDVANRRVLPVLFHLDSADPATLYLCEWDGDLTREAVAPVTTRIALRLVELPRTV